MTDPARDYRDADARLLLLQYLHGAPAYTAHEHELRTLLARDGHRLSADAVRGHLAWLEEQRMIQIGGTNVMVATATERGCDVAAGDKVWPGIAKPRPGA